MIRTRQISLLGSAIALTVGALGFATPAQADTACPVNSICTYSSADLSGEPAIIAASDIEAAKTNGVVLPAGARSFVNQTEFTVRYGTARKVTCVRYPCYQYTTLGKLAPGAHTSLLPNTQTSLKIGQDLGD
ncbi:peptidase inhibitor family I36 protein [Streptomyces sp. NPDC054765]